MSVLAEFEEYIVGKFKFDENKIFEISDIEFKGMTSGIHPPIF